MESESIIPSYLLSNGIEFFALNNEGYMLKNGSVLPFDQFDPDTIAIIEQEYLSDKEAQIGLAKMGIHPDVRLKQFIICKYGTFDTMTDIEPNGQTNHERYDCGKRGVCPGENLVCKAVECRNGIITPRLETALKLIAKGMLDKEGASKMFISEHTFKNHRRKLQKLIGTNNKAGLAAFAVSKNLI